jgi:hypothetical protein
MHLMYFLACIVYHISYNVYDGELPSWFVFMTFIVDIFSDSTWIVFVRCTCYCIIYEHFSSKTSSSYGALLHYLHTCFVSFHYHYLVMIHLYNISSWSTYILMLCITYNFNNNFISIITRQVNALNYEFIIMIICMAMCYYVDG